MPLVSRLSNRHTIQEFRTSAGMRYREALHSANAEDRLAAIYLAGYSAEMLLKGAYFRFCGKAPTTLISLSDIQGAMNYAKKILHVTWADRLHDLTGWAALLIEERRVRGSPYKWEFARSIQAHVKRIYLNWREYLRYYRNRPHRGEVTVVLQGVQYLLVQYRNL